MSRAARLVTTRAGIQIGAAYIPPPARPGSEAERIQRVLLTTPTPPGASDYLAAAVALLITQAGNALRDADLVALYLAHRRKGAGRCKSLRGAVRCWLPSSPHPKAK